jgi:hypothetical protein
VCEFRRLCVDIERPAVEAYEFLSQPQNLARWASGLAGTLYRDGDDWIAETPEGPARVRFWERNAFGVLDHAVTLPDGTTVYVPLRVLPRGGGCELALTLFRRRDMSDERFAADADWVMRDLNMAKRILEG